MVKYSGTLRKVFITIVHQFQLSLQLAGETLKRIKNTMYVCMLIIIETSL